MHRRRRIIFSGSAFVVALTMSILLLPLPVSLRQPATGTLTLLDCRGREIAEIASPEARAQLPKKLDEMGNWLPRVTVALEDHRFYEHGAMDWHASAGAIARNCQENSMKWEIGCRA